MTNQEQLDILKKWLGLHRGLIFKIVRAYAHSPMDQDELFQEIVLQVWRSVPSFRQESSAATWLYRIALNVAIKWTRKELKHTPSESLDNIGHLLQENKTPPDERLTWLYQQIYALDPIDRSVILLLLEGFSYKEMAVILGITESNVGVKINRIKKQFITKSKNYTYNGI